MSMKPMYAAGSSADDILAQIKTGMPTNEVFVKDSDGSFDGTGMRRLSDGTLLAPENFAVESGSIDVGDLITLSEAGGYLAIWNNVDSNQYYMVDYPVPKDAPSGNPRYFRLTEAENLYVGQPDQTQTLTFNPLTFSYTTQLNARTNSFYLTAASAMTNVKIKITNPAAGVVLKYLPTKAAWETPTLPGYNFAVGDNLVDFGDSPLPLSAGVMLSFEIKADNVSLKGSSANIPSIKSMVQRGEVVVLSSSDQITATSIRDALVSLDSPNKLPKTAIQDGVLSVNGAYGNVVITAEGINAQPRSSNLDQISSINLLPDSILYTDSSSGLRTTALSNFVRNTFNIENDQDFRNYIGLGSSATLDTNVSNGVLQLDENGKIPSNLLEITLATVATSGSYSDLLDKPEIPTVSYPVTSVNSKTGDVVISYSDVGAAPLLHTHTISQVTGLQESLDSKLGNQDTIPYSRITGTPTIPAAQVNSDWNSTSGVSQILNKPSLFNGDYNSLSNLPVIPSAQIQSDWNQTNTSSLDYIKNKPTIPTINYPVTSVNTKTGAVVLTNTDVGAAAAVHIHAITDVTGLQTALDSKITTGSSIPYSTLTGTPTIPSNGSFSFVGLNDTDNTVVNSGYLQWNSTGTSVQYVSTIPYTAITGTPTIPTNNNQLTNGAGYITSSGAPVQSVNGKTGVVVLTASDVGAASSGSIPTNNSFTFVGLSDTDNTVVNNGFLRWNSTGTSVSYSSTIPYSVLTGAPTLSTVATSGSYVDLLNKPTLFDGTWTSLTGKPTTLSGYGITDAVSQTSLTSTLSGYATTTALTSGLSGKYNTPAGTTSQYVRGDGTLASFPTIPAAQVQTDWNATSGLGVILNKPTLATVATSGNYTDLINRPTIPTVPTVVSAFTNDSGYVTATTAPVTSVNTKTGAVSLTYTDVGAAPTIQGTKYYRPTNVQASGVKVKYYTATTDANGAWTLALGTDFTEILDVQVQAVSTAGVTGLRQATINTYTSTSTSLTGSVFGSTLIATVLISALQSLTLISAATVKLRVEGIGT